MSLTRKELIANLGDLPPLPQVAVRVLKTADDPDATTHDLTEIITTDSALAAQILRIANSPMFGMMRDVHTLTQAVMILGFTVTKSVAIASSAMSLYTRGQSGLEERILWVHALTCALTSKALGSHLGYAQTEECFLGGLLHDIGKSLLCLKFPSHYGSLLRSAYNDGKGLSEMEVNAYGFDHAAVGEALVHSWGLTKELEQAVRWHHEPVKANKSQRPLTAIVALGNLLAIEQKTGIGEPSHLAEATAQALEILGLEAAKLEEQRLKVLESLEKDKALILDF